MRIGRVVGNLTLSRRLPELGSGTLLVVEALDAAALEAMPEARRRSKPMPESLIVYDQLGATAGQLIAISEGREAAMPFYPNNVPVDAYNAAILDTVQLQA